MKVTFGEQTLDLDNDESKYYLANLDTYGGNSGSPVLSPASGLVEGILVDGQKDYEFFAEKGCYESRRCRDDGQDCSLERVTRTTVFAAHVSMSE